MGENTLYRVHQKLRHIPIIDEEITHVDLRRNDIREITIPKNKNITYLDLSDNKIKLMENLDMLPSLKVLDLSYNLLEKIKQPPPKLKELYLIANDIDKIENLALEDLVKLDLAVNNIKIIENLTNCFNLNELYLGSNSIEKMGDLRNLSSLRVLDLQNNLIEEVDCSLLPQSLETLLLSDNKNLKHIKNLESLPKLKLLTFERTGIKEIENCVNIEIWK